jgi:hypothetical protein
MLTEPPARGLLGVHAFACALPTRGGICDCQPDTPGDPAEPYQTTGDAVSESQRASLYPLSHEKSVPPPSAA